MTGLPRRESREYCGVWCRCDESRTQRGRL